MRGIGLYNMMYLSDRKDIKSVNHKSCKKGHKCILYHSSLGRNFNTSVQRGSEVHLKRLGLSTLVKATIMCGVYNYTRENMKRLCTHWS